MNLQEFPGTSKNLQEPPGTFRNLQEPPETSSELKNTHKTPKKAISVNDFHFLGKRMKSMKNY